MVKNAPDKAKRKLDADGNPESDADRASRLLTLRHSGVLGLCAFVDAFPYDVPEFVPEILMFLSDFLHVAPQPIPVRTKREQEFLLVIRGQSSQPLGWEIGSDIYFAIGGKMTLEFLLNF